MYKRITAILLIFCLLACRPVFLPADAQEALTRAPLTAGSARSGMVRVRLSSLGNPSVLNLTVQGSYSINGQTAQPLQSGSSLTVNFSASTGQLTLTQNGVSLPMGSSFRLCRHETTGENGIRIAQGRAPKNLYPGDFQFLTKKSGSAYALYVIVHVYMEEYLYGVLPYEMGNSSHIEALKAQAVAARTYTMRAMNASSSALYDVVDTTGDQVYSGTPSGSAACKAAVDATKGIVAKNGSSLTATYYTASNGGQTESIKNAWGTNGYDYLKVKDDPYDLANPESRAVSFQVNASGSQSNGTLGALLNQKAAAVYGSGAYVTAVTGVSAHTPRFASPSRLYTKMSFSVQYARNGYSGSGVLTFDIFGELESSLGMSINSGANELWSVTQTASGFTVTARRYGHGIGMSQRGAMYMAQIGYTYDQILAFYFEGCSRVQYTLTRSILSPIVPGQDSHEETITENPAPLETPTPSPVPPTEAGTARVVTREGSLNLRESPALTSKVLYTIPQYTVIPVLARIGDWCQTTYNGFTGFVMSSFLAFSDQPAVTPTPTASPSPAPAPGQETLYARVTTAQGSLNLRKSAQTTARVLCTISRMAVIPILEKGAAWCKTVYGGQTGYVMTSFLTFLDGGPTETPVVIPVPTATPTLGGALYARVSTPSGSLNLRSAPRDTARVLRTIPQNDYLVVLNQSGDWCCVAYAGTTGYVMRRFLAFDSSSAPFWSSVHPTAAPPTAAPATSSPSGALRQLAHPVPARIISDGSLNLRNACSTNARIIAEMPAQDFVTLTAVGEIWCAVTYEGQSGYCMIRYLEYTLNE